MNSIPKIDYASGIPVSINRKMAINVPTPIFKGCTGKIVRVREAVNTNKSDIFEKFRAALGFWGILNLAVAGIVSGDISCLDSPENESVEAGKTDTINQVKADKYTAKRAAKKAAKIARLEEKGVTDIEEIGNNTIRFVYAGITYELTNSSPNNVNMYKLLNKVVGDDPTVGKYEIKALIGSEECDCDWGIGEAARVTETLCKIVESDEKLLNNRYYTVLFEEYVTYMTSVELNSFIDAHKSIALRTEKVCKYLEYLRNKNPGRYIEIMTPEKLFETEYGRGYLQKNAPEIFKSLLNSN